MQNKMQTKFPQYEKTQQKKLQTKKVAKPKGSQMWLQKVCWEVDKFSWALPKTKQYIKQQKTHKSLSEFLPEKH